MVEQRFNQLRKTLKPEEFNSIEFLEKKAESLKTEDPQLSARILVRVSNLKKQQKKLSENNKTPKKSTAPVVKTQQKTSLPPKTKTSKLKSFCSSPFFLCVIIPSLLFSFYQIVWATERFESRAQVIVQKPDSASTMDAGMALLSGLGGTSGGSDTELLKAYIYSNNMLEYLNEELDLRAHYSQSSSDYFSRVHDDDSEASFLAYYKKHVTVSVNDKSGVVTIDSQAFDADFAQKLTKKIVKRAEWYINSIGHQLAKAQLTFIKGEYQNVETRLQGAQTELLNFQQRYNLLDPTAEGTAMQQIAYTLAGQISAKQTELKTSSAIMSDRAPQIIALQNELKALNEQLKKERDKLSQNDQDVIPVSEILAKFTDLKVKVELALQAYTSSQVSLEKSRIEAYRQIKYLVVVEDATLSDESKYPDSFYNISLFLLLASIFFGIGKIIFSTIQELK